MELEWLEDFLSVARTGNFSRSAEERFMTQPAFSRRIRALELWLGATLIDRSTYPTRLTPSGRLFRDTAEDTLRRLHSVRDELRGTLPASRGVINCSAMHSISVSFFPQWLRTLEQRVGAINSRMISDNMHNCVQLLVEGNCDFLLCYAHPAMPILLEPTRYPYLVLGQDRMIAVAACGRDKKPLFKLPGSKRTPIPYLGYAPGSFLGRAVDLILNRRDTSHHLHLCYENALAESLKSMAVARHGLAWLPEGSIKPELKRKSLVRAGGSKWELSLELRLYRAIEKTRPEVEEIWSALSPPAPHSTNSSSGRGMRKPGSPSSEL